MPGNSAGVCFCPCVRTRHVHGAGSGGPDECNAGSFRFAYGTCPVRATPGKCRAVRSQPRVDGCLPS